jgi:polyisoprenoid-binding protein YceI
VRNAACRAVVLACAGVVVLPAVAQTVLYDKSRISCVSRQMNVPVEAQFKTFSARIAFDPVHPEAGRARIEIELASFDIDNTEVNDEVRGKAWFDAGNFPRATFVSASIRRLDGTRFEVRGPLAIKGRTHEVVAPFTYQEVGGTGTFEGAFAIKRLQFNIGDGVWKDTDTVADEVQIKFRIVAVVKPAAKK